MGMAGQNMEEIATAAEATEEAAATEEASQTEEEKGE